MITMSLLSVVGLFATIVLLISGTADVCLAAETKTTTALGNAETTTSLLPLQPPFNVTSTTTTSVFQQQQQPKDLKKQHEGEEAKAVEHGEQQAKHWKGDVAGVVSKEIDSNQDNKNNNNDDDSWLNDSTKKRRKYKVLGPRTLPANHQNQLGDYSEKSSSANGKPDDSLRYVHGFISQTVLKNETNVVPTNSHGYIQFELNSQSNRAVENGPRPQNASTKVVQQRGDKQETVNAVLSSLFPNGFSDIFRFSYAAEPEPAPTQKPLTTTATPTVSQEPQPSTTTTIAPSTRSNQTIVSFASSVTREYRRELSPGHTQIVVEQIQRTLPHATSSEEFRDGNNQITRDDLLRINRAAVDAPVLPSLLLKPEKEVNDTTVDSNKPKHEPIVILNENQNPESDEIDESDNQIAETQHIGAQFYQTLPYHIVAQHQQPEINVHIVHDDTLAAAQAESYQTRQQQQQQPQDSENYVQEAPSRKFLKNFKPMLSESANRPIPKGNFHYEVQQGQHYGNYGTYYAKPNLQYQEMPQLSSKLPNSKPQLTKDYNGYITADQSTDTPQSVVFVTLNTPPQHLQAQPAAAQQEVVAVSPSPSPHSYVSDALQESPEIKPNGNPAYTFVEVQKSVNIHNKLITEKDGRLVEQHETIYPQRKAEQQQQQQQQQKREQPEQTTNYQPLSTNPINVQNTDNDAEHYAEAASQTVQQHVKPTAESQVHISQSVQEADHHNEHYSGHSEEQHRGNQQLVHYETAATHDTQVAHVEQPVHYAHEVEHHAVATPQEYVETQAHEHHDHHDHHHAAHVDNHVEIEEQHMAELHPAPVHVHTAHAQPAFHVQEIVEHHIPVPYAVPEPVPVPVHVEHYIDRPYPVETIVEKRVPYPVEKVVEKIVEKQVPVEVERIVEKPVEKIVKKYVDRPVAVPIHVPVAIHIPPHSMHDYGHPSAMAFEHSGFGHTGFGHYGSPGWGPQPGHSVGVIPEKVLRNYYTRMLKKLMPKIPVMKPKTPTKPPNSNTQQPNKVQQPKPSKAPPSVGNLNSQSGLRSASYNFIDSRHIDLIPPPPPSSASWSQGARYVYNTLPRDLTASGASAYASVYDRFKSPVRSAPPAAKPASSSPATEPYDEFQRWRNGHTLKRSPDFGRNLHMEYGFKPPLVPSLEIDDRGMPLNKASNDKAAT